MTMRIAVLASGEGTTLQAMIDAVRAGRLRAEIVLVVSNHPHSGAIRRAGAHGIPTAWLNGVTHPDPNELDRAIADALRNSKAEWVVLAGYMKQIGPLMLAAFPGRILNTHPSLLPRHGGKGMYGKRVYEAILAGGDTETGVTIHLVDAEYDTGPILTQTRLSVPPNSTVDSLQREVQALERGLLCETLQCIADGSIRSNGGG